MGMLVFIVHVVACVSNWFQCLLFFIIIIFKIYLFLTALALHCCVCAFSGCAEQWLPLLVAAASPVAEHRLQVAGASVVAVMGSYEVQLVGSREQAHYLWRTGSAALRPVGSSQTRDQSCPLHWQVDS